MTVGSRILIFFALVPAAVTPPLIVQEATLQSVVCGSGQALSIPLGKPALPGTEPATCCAKGCNGNQRRNGKNGKIDPEQ